MEHGTDTGQRAFADVFGDRADSIAARLAEWDPEAAALAMEIAYGKFWSRDGLVLRERSIATVAALIATHRTQQLELHFQGLVNLGMTRAEIRELALQLIPYVGFPAVFDALAVLRDLPDSSLSARR